MLIALCLALFCLAGRGTLQPNRTQLLVSRDGLVLKQTPLLAGMLRALLFIPDSFPSGITPAARTGAEIGRFAELLTGTKLGATDFRPIYRRASVIVLSYLLGSGRLTVHQMLRLVYI